jgi:hypothetical protein
MYESKPTHRRLRFSIRDLGWLTLLAAVLIAWWLDHRELTKQNLGLLTVYSLSNADAKTTAEAVQAIYLADRNVRVVAESKQNRVIVNAPTRQHAEIQAIIMKLDEGK